MLYDGVSNSVEGETGKQERGELPEKCLNWAREVGTCCMFQGIGLSQEQGYFSHQNKREGNLCGIGTGMQVDVIVGDFREVLF